MTESRIVTPVSQLDDDALEATIRPRRFAEYLGQDAVREQLAIYIEAARRRGGALDHVLIFGPPGLGKTTLSHVIANELGVNLRSTSGPVLERAGDLAALLTNLQPNDVLFVDEIHRLSPAVEEVLYPAMEDFQIDIMIGEGPAARSIKLDLPPFTLVGATTRAGMLTAPLRDRFGIVQRLEFYTVDELTAIVRRAAKILDIACAIEGAQEIARRARGTPRIANRLLRRVRDYAEVRAGGQITLAAAQAALDMLKIDPDGLDELDRRMLGTIIESFDGGPVGVESLAAALSEDRGTLEDVVEPYLIQQGYLVRTARGRMASARAWRHLGRNPPPRQPQATDLFAGTPSMAEREPFRWPVRVYWEDTDAGGVVYHASYLRFLERARSEWLRALGVSQMAYKESTGLAFLVREMQLDFLRAALLDDELSISVAVKERRAASILFSQTIDRADDGACLVRAGVRVACVDTRRMRAVPMPADLFPESTP